MYELIYQVIAQHTYKDSNALLAKIQRMYVEGELDEDQYSVLRAKLAEAEPVKTYDVVAELDKVWQEIRAINARIDGLQPAPEPGPDPEPEPEIPEWVQPTGASDAYQTGDKVRYKGEVYESLIDGNVWAPDVYPGGWSKISWI